MKGNAKAAATLGVGYWLGRQHKLRAATAMAAATAIGRKGVGGIVVARGAKLVLGSGALRRAGKLLRRIT
jgi:hypothetical protein